MAVRSLTVRSGRHWVQMVSFSLGVSPLSAVEEEWASELLRWKYILTPGVSCFLFYIIRLHCLELCYSVLLNTYEIFHNKKFF